MTTELGNLSSANGSSVQRSDKSGQVAAQLFSGTVEDAGVAPQGERESKELTRSVQQSPADIEKQVQNLQEFGQLQGWTVNFSVEKELDQVVIKVMDAETKSMIRQIPSEELIAINKRIQALRQGDAGAHPRIGLLLDSEI
ncbi:flagellar protein FlaG [Aeromonas caviae]|uniref:flagellar protein FlaG n=1 Tax=Aeromonas caviae TaxID=648 RepID=UPI000F5DF23E|nr:flagellar protein FlaG [Aeromonas caviae]RQX24758.1 flagellar protein FlaG [Aeromonas caviae]